MITKLRIKGFQKHSEPIVLRFAPGVNTLVGDNGAGKSSIVRALQWLALNTPSGNGFINTDSSKARVTGWFVDGHGVSHKVSRTKGSSTNTYEVDGSVLSAFGTSIPHPITEATGLHDVHFQTQMDPLFWVSLTPTQLSERIRNIVSIDFVADVMASLKFGATQAASEVKVQEAFLSDAEETCKKYRKLPDLFESLKPINELVIEIGKVGVEYNTINEATQADGNLWALIEATPLMDRISEQIVEALAWDEARAMFIDDMVEVSDLWDSVLDARKEIKRLSAELSQFKECPTCGGLYREKE